MPKFLTTIGRLNLSLILILCGLGSLVGMVLSLTHPRFGPSFRIAGMVLSLATGLALLAIAVYLQHSLPTSRDLLAAAAAEREAEERSRFRRRSLAVRHLKFGELSRGMKAVAILLITLGGVAIAAGVSHFFGFLPQLQFQSVGGRTIAISRWATAGLLMVVGLACASLSLLLRIRYIDRWDEALRQLFRGAKS